MIHHSSPISGIDAYYPHVATAGYDNRIILWDARTHEALAETRHDHLANQCKFSTSGTLLASSGSDYSARIWTIPDLKLIAVLADQDDDVEMTVISPDERHVATASRDHLVRIYTSDGRLVHRMAGHTSDVLSVEWAANGSQLITSGDDATMRRWDVTTGSLLETTGLGDVETDTIVLVGNNTLFLGNDNGELVAISSDSTPRFFPAHQAGIKRLSFDQQARTLVSASYDRTVKFWDLTPDGPVQKNSTSVPPDVWPRSFAKLNESSWVFGTFGTTYAEFNNSIPAWNTSPVQPTPGINAVSSIGGNVYTVGDAGEVHKNHMHLSLPGSCCNFLVGFNGGIFTGGQLGTLFDALTGASLFTHSSPLNCATTIGGGEAARLVIGSYTGEALIFRSDGSRIRFEREVKLHNNAIKGLAAHTDVLFSVCATGAVGFHRYPDWRMLQIVPDAHDRICNGAASLNSGEFVSVSRDRTLRLWSERSERLCAVNTPHKNSIKCVAADSIRRLVATGGYRGQVAVYDLDAGRWVYDRRVTHAGISSLSATSDSGTFLASSYDGTVYPIKVDRS